MKARKYDRKILQKGIVPNVYAIQESGNITDSIIEFIQKHDEKIVNDVIYLKEIFESGKEFGSLIQVKNIDFDRLRTSLNEIIDKSKSTLTDINITNIISNDLMALINQAELLSKQYSAVVTNPPYMNKFEKNLKDFAKKYYKDYSKDLFSMFIYRNFKFCKKNCYTSLISPFSWMFLKSFENLRTYLINTKTISSLIQLEYNAFTEIAMVPAGIYVFKNHALNQKYNGIFFKLSEFKGNMDVQKNKVLEAMSNNVDYKFISNSTNYSSIPGSPISYYLPDNIYEIFKKSTPLKEIDTPVIGVASHDDSYFLKRWFEVNFNKISFNSTETFQEPLKWFPYNKGGSFRKWYGNNEFVINFENDGEELKNFKNAQIKNRNKYFIRGMTWSRISSSNISVRYHENGFIMGDAGPSAFAPDNLLYYILGLLNSSIIQIILSSINPTLNYQVGNISEIPVLKLESYDKIDQIVTHNINLCKNDWDNFETSWDFKTHHLLGYNQNNMRKCFEQWSILKENNFNQLKINEMNLNQIFSEIYAVEIENNIKDEFISINLADYATDIKSFISYAIGCMFGRYSLDNEGLQFAGGDFNINNYQIFLPDDDNIIPVLDTAYFDDDIVGYFTKFVETCFGKKTLEENLDFIAGALSKSKKPSREIIRQYLLKNFFNDHKRTYKKCPIYWQFSSGKHNGFNCLVYMHRYEPSLVARIRTDYLHKTQKAIEQKITNNDNIINNSTSKQEVTRATKKKAKLQKQLKETHEYDEVLAHIANQNIEIDLDDGVKVNYAKFQNIEIKKEGSKTKKVNLLKKI